MAELREKHQRVMADLGDDPAEDEEEDATAWIQGPNGVAVPATISADEWKQQELHGLRTRSFWAQMHQVQATSGQPNLQQIQQLLQQFRANPTPESHPSDAASKDIKPQ